jgi:hypothetical protein
VWLDGFLFREPHFAPARLNQHAVEVRRERGHSLLHACSHVATLAEIVDGNTLRRYSGPSRWVRPLAYVTGSVNQGLLLRNEYLAAENRILRTKLPPRLRLPARAK